MYDLCGQWFHLDRELSPRQVVPSVSTTEHTAIANQLLTDARLLREQLAAESTEANRKLSEAVLAVIMYTEDVENVSRLLGLADSRVGQIRSQMRAHGIPIHPPSSPSNTVTVSDVDAAVVQGESYCPHIQVAAFLWSTR